MSFSGHWVLILTDIREQGRAKVQSTGMGPGSSVTDIKYT